jgi:uncharacterized membrane protein
MSSKKTTPERLTSFSDALFAVIITIMVLDLKPPAEATLKPSFIRNSSNVERQSRIAVWT